MTATHSFELVLGVLLFGWLVYALFKAGRKRPSEHLVALCIFFGLGSVCIVIVMVIATGQVQLPAVLMMLGGLLPLLILAIASFTAGKSKRSNDG